MHNIGKGEWTKKCDPKELLNQQMIEFIPNHVYKDLNDCKEVSIIEKLITEADATTNVTDQHANSVLSNITKILLIALTYFVFFLFATTD